MANVEIIAYGIISLQILALLWLAKGIAGSIWLFARERHYIDLVIAIFFAGLAVDRVSIINSSFYLYRFIPDAPSQEFVETMVWRLASVIALNLCFFIYDISFFNYKPPPGER